MTIISYWDQHWNSLFACPRSTIKITIPHIITQGSDGDDFVYDRELGEYVYRGPLIKRCGALCQRLLLAGPWQGTTYESHFRTNINFSNFAGLGLGYHGRIEPSIEVNITANQPSGWMMPLVGDIKLSGKSDVVLNEVVLTTNGGAVSMEHVAANAIAVDAAAGAINLTMVSSPNMTVMARASRVFGSTIPVLPFGNSRTVESGDVLLQYIDLERWREFDRRDRSYQSRVEGYSRPLYDRIPAGNRFVHSPENVMIGDLRVVSEFSKIDIENIVHGNIDIDVNGNSETAAALDLSGMGGDISIVMNAFEMQGLYDFNTDSGDIAFEVACEEAVIDIRRTCDDDDETDCPNADEVKGVYGRIGNVYDMRTFSPMNHRFNIDVEVEKRSGASVDITLNMDCQNLKRCPNDCSFRGVCNPDFGRCACQPADWYNHTSVFYGSACEYKHCPNDCSGTGTCDHISGECTCWDRYYDAHDLFPCTKVICDDGPHPRSTNPDRPNLDAMECGRCTMPYNNSYCEPVDFMSPTAMFSVELDWDAIVRRNSHLASNETADATMYDHGSPAYRETQLMIAAEVTNTIAPLNLVASPDLVRITCFIVESGLEGSWSTTHDASVGLNYLDTIRMAGSSLAEVSCTAAEVQTLMHGGYPQALDLINLTLGGEALASVIAQPGRQTTFVLSVLCLSLWLEI